MKFDIAIIAYDAKGNKAQKIELENQKRTKDNKHVERMRAEINASDKLTGSRMMDIAVKRDSPIGVF